MRTFVHLILLLCGIAIGAGAFLPVLEGTKPTNVRLEDLRDGFPAGWVLEQLGDQSVTFYRSMAILVLAAGVLIVIAALFGSRLLSWLGVIVGLVALGAFYYRVDQAFGDYVREHYSTVLTNQLGFALIAGGLLVALLASLVPREKTAV